MCDIPQVTSDDVFVSTHTFMSYTNINELDLDLMFDEININEFLIHMLYKKKDLKREKNLKTIPKFF